MRVALLTGGLEPGRDGVGDYSRSLAVEATRQGAACRLLALADRHTANVIAGRDESGIEMLRLPFTMPWTQRVRAARQFLAASAGDWVSLQFVPYSFHRWGVASKLVRVLPELVGQAQLHVMFHEVWIDGGSSLRTKLLSFAQRRAVRSLAGYPPALMHTSNGTYQHALAQHGISAGTLPLFGSVPVAAANAASWLASPLAGVGCDAWSNDERRKDWWLFAFFGTIHPVWPPQPLLDELNAAAAAAGKRVALIAVGRLGAGESIWTRMQEQFGARVPMLRLGEQPAPGFPSCSTAWTSASPLHRLRSWARARRLRRCSITGCRWWSTATTAPGRRRLRVMSGKPRWSFEWARIWRPACVVPRGCPRARGCRKSPASGWASWP